ncbi:MAG: carboxypeptidase-like regulatory domain-containing protein [Chitinophagales bacterium]
MKKTIENKITMYKTIYTHCNQNLSLITPNVGLNAVFTEFATLFNALLPIAQVQIQNNKGIAKNKMDARLQLVNGLYKAAGALMSHFSSVHDHEIYDKVKIAKSAMKTMRDMKLSVHAQTVIDLVTNNQAVLAPFGVDTAYITNLETLRDAFLNQVSLPTVASNGKKVATSDLSEDVFIIDQLLATRLDPAMRALADSAPLFYKKYLNGRRINNVGIRHKNNTGTLKGIVKDAETDLILTDALIEIINTPTMIVTNELGEFTIMGIPPETYSIKISAGDYDVKIVENITIVAKQVTQTEIKLTPAA